MLGSSTTSSPSRWLRGFWRSPYLSARRRRRRRGRKRRGRFGLATRPSALSGRCPSIHDSVRSRAEVLSPQTGELKPGSASSSSSIVDRKGKRVRRSPCRRHVSGLSQRHHCLGEGRKGQRFQRRVGRELVGIFLGFSLCLHCLRAVLRLSAGPETPGFLVGMDLQSFVSDGLQCGAVS